MLVARIFTARTLGILHKDKKHLRDLFLEIENYLQENLLLEVKSNWQVFPSFIRGIDFVGYRSFGDYTLLRKSTAKRFKKKMKHISNKPKLNHRDRSSIASYSGWLKWCNSYRLANKHTAFLQDGDIV